MIVIFEGFECVGKTTLANEISNKLNIPYFRSSRQISSGINLEQAIKYDWLLLFDVLKQTKSNIIFDRSFISQWVYSNILRKENILKEFGSLEEYNKLFDYYCDQLNSIDHLVVYCKRNSYKNIIDDFVDIDKYNLFNSTFEEFFKSFNITNFLKCDFENGIDFNVKLICG